MANKLRLLRLSQPVRAQLQQYGLSERHARALLRLSDEESQLHVLRQIVARGYNVARTEEYVEEYLQQLRTTPPKGRSTYIIKDVRLFLNSINRGMHLMRSAGVNAAVGRQDTEDEILLTIRIPKRGKLGA